MKKFLHYCRDQSFNSVSRNNHTFSLESCGTHKRTDWAEQCELDFQASATRSNHCALKDYYGR
jgi:hypothetical protein